MEKKLNGKIRKVKKEDLIQCQDIIYACLNLVCEDNKKNIKLRKYYSFINLEKYLKNSKIFYVFEKNGVVLGMGRISKNSEIKTIYIDPSYHRKGIGKKIIIKIEGFLIKTGAKKVYLHALKLAIPFYEKQGYSKVNNFIKRRNRMEKKLYSSYS